MTNPTAEAIAAAKFGLKEYEGQSLQSVVVNLAARVLVLEDRMLRATKIMGALSALVAKTSTSADVEKFMAEVGDL